MVARGVFKVIVLFLTFALIGCSTQTTEPNKVGEEKESTARGGELKIAVTAQPPTLDTHVTTSTTASDIAHHIFEPLVTVDSNYNIKPMLADSWEQSEDNKTYTFHLRKGVHFHNGKELVADDVVASMSRWAKKASLGKENFSDATFEAKDADTVVMKLAHPLSSALRLLAYEGGNEAAIMPKEIIEGAGEDGVKEYIGTGPFAFKEWKQDQQIQLTRYADYQPRTEPSDGLSGKKEALVDNLYFIFAKDTSTQTVGLLTGEYDIAYMAAYDSVEQLKSNSEIETYLDPGSSISIYFNKKQGLFSNVAARQAVATAVNMEDILKAAYAKEEYYMKNHNILMYHQTNIWGSDVGKDKYNQHDLEKAKKLLKDAGYNGEEVTMIATRDYKDMYDASVVVQQELEQLGMKIKMEVYDYPTFSKLRTDENKWGLLVLANAPKPADPTTQLFMSKNFVGWTNSPELDTLINQFKSAPSSDEAKVIYDKLQAWFYEYIPVAKIGDSKVVTAVRNTVKNYRYLDGPIYWNVSNNK